MRRKVISIIALVVCVTSLSLAQDSQNTQSKNLPNFHQVNSNLYRGGQPKKEGLLELKQKGVKTIINLRDDDSRAKTEAKDATGVGLRYFNIPFGSFGRPNDKDVEAVLKLVNSPENQPVFVHCKRGSDRTGTVIAIYRMAHDGWTSEKAKAEANQYGMGFWEVKMKDYIHDYYERHIRGSDNSGSPTTNP